jgi:hypothetical protein
VAAAATSVPGVARLVGGTGVEASTHYPGGKVVGVALSADVVSVHCVVDRLPLAPVIDALFEVVGGVLAEAGDARPVRVVVEDVEEVGLTSAFSRAGGAAGVVRGAGGL